MDQQHCESENTYNTNTNFPFQAELCYFLHVEKTEHLVWHLWCFSMLLLNAVKPLDVYIS